MSFGHSMIETDAKNLTQAQKYANSKLFTILIQSVWYTDIMTYSW